jgi:aldose 1-epimerase
VISTKDYHRRHDIKKKGNMMFSLYKHHTSINMKITRKPFGKTSSNEEVTLYTISNDNGMKVSFIDYGANIVSIVVPDSKGNGMDVALGFENIEGYEENPTFFGSLIGRYANRIGNARFELNGKVYELEKNDGNNNLHSSFSGGYHKKIYQAEIFEEKDAASIEFSRLSPHMEQGFPGNLEVSVTYTLTGDNELVIEYFAVSECDTVINLTNHSYFNLGGHDSGTILDHNLWIKASRFTPTTSELIPTGELRDVTGTPLDFRTMKIIGRDIEADYEPLRMAGGYDHNYVLDISCDEIEKVAELVHEKSGRVLEVFTDMPGMQFYSGNMLTPVNNCKGGKPYQRRGGLCFETQFFPNSCNIKSFPSSILKAGEEFDAATIYKFSAR